MLATVPSASLLGIAGRPIAVEVHVGDGLPGFTVVGLPDASVREARDRVRAAIQSSGLPWPNRKVTVNLAPSGVPKAGVALDLAIAVGVLSAEGVVGAHAGRTRSFIAELGLDGTLRPVPGALPLVRATGTRSVVVAAANVNEALLVEGCEVCTAASLTDLVAMLNGERPWPRLSQPPPTPPPAPLVDLDQVQGQRLARFAAEVAAAGGHHLLLIGPPGAGKTMVAKALSGLLPALDGASALEVTTIHSAAGLALPRGGLVTAAPYRAPHHTSSTVALVGGGARQLRPGEISCAHRGVLFLDELGEFPAQVLDALRQPLEEGSVRVARACGSTTFPAQFILVGATNPCPCGEGDEGARPCRCSDTARERYRRRLSGPLLDRLDLRVQLRRPRAEELFCTAPAESTAEVAERVATARALARDRGIESNVQIRPDQADRLAPLAPEGRALLVDAVKAGRLSARGVHRARCVARTIADLRGNEGDLQEAHVAGALALRADLVDQIGVRR